jgi:hypothetical protein
MNHGLVLGRFLSVITAVIMVARTASAAPPDLLAQAARSPPPADVSPSPSAASSPEDKKAEATEHFDEGMKLAKNGSWGPALTRFLQSRKLYPTWGNTSAAARCLAELERYDEALATLALAGLSVARRRARRSGGPG